MTANTAANVASSSRPASPADRAVLPLRQEPIPQPSEPMQFRAIGLVRARYIPEEEQITKGQLVTPEGAAIEAVLLGRIMSLVKKHIDLDQEHLWVVYPRTREREGNLHVQVVGIWEPETLQKQILKDSEPEQTEDGLPRPIRPKPPIKSSSDLPDGYFSIRGEVVFHSAERERIVIKIKQAPRPNDHKSRSFKLQLQGKLGPKAIHHFWDLKAIRQGDMLVVKEGTCIGAIPQRRPARKGAGGGGGGRRFDRRGSGGPPRRAGGSDRPSAPPRREGSPSSSRPVKQKPVLKKRDEGAPSGEAES